MRMCLILYDVININIFPHQRVRDRITYYNSVLDIYMIYGATIFVIYSSPPIYLNSISLQL